MNEEISADLLGAVCPTPIFNHKQIVLGHGSGGKLSSDLIHKIFLPAFDNDYLARLDDQAVLQLNGSRVAFTTDAFVVTPLFFPGGDIGQLAINGTVNDLAMSGAKPLYIAAAFILEEGLATDELQRVVNSMSVAAREANVLLVTGDTKVVNRGKGDKVFITTTGLGLVDNSIQISADRARPGDKILLSGTIGDHGMAIMSQRENLAFEGTIESDTAALHGLVAAMLAACVDIHCLRDPTRGGVATTLNEIATSSGVGMVVDERQIPVREAVKGACEILGLDPLYVANEGKLLAIVASDSTAAVLQRMREHPLGRDAQVIGEVVDDHPRMVLMKTGIGGTRVVDLLFGEQLPRIC
ncbi:MAG TPA: hydrogenase expression/formation protein HypE [Candidatus Binatia bacterium]|nr:hydrogenase expression/formation protein HypE [Candidatus Binatia bacterium]HXV84034.1 hydrogenase expression/formation protein HypE [Candidatus Binatia bacterium]